MNGPWSAPPPTADRPPHRLTGLVLTAGTLTAGGLLLVGLALSLAGAAAGDAEGWSLAGTLVLLATPAAGLLATAFELRRAQPRAALLALVVLGVLGLAVLVAVA